MQIVMVIFLIGVAGLFPVWGDPGAERANEVKKKIITREKISDYIETESKKTKYQTCVQRGGGLCRDKYRQAFHWCVKNPDKCLPLIEGTGASATQFATQEAAKCRNELERRCRAQAGL